jgi:hypothetical protein
MRNPDFVPLSSDESDSRFRRFVELNMKLDQAGLIHWVAASKEDVLFNILITGYCPAHSATVREYIKLLGLPVPADESEDIILPVHFAVKGVELGGISISTRSTYDLIEILRAAVEIPREHAAAGLTRNYLTPGPAGRDIRIHASKDKPKRAAVAVKHRGYWFYIDDADMRTKLFYAMVRTLWSVSISAAAGQTAAPVLTIPVSR